MGRNHGSSSTYRSPGTQHNLRLTAREQRRAHERSVRRATGKITPQVKEAHVRRVEDGYCVLHDCID